MTRDELLEHLRVLNTRTKDGYLPDPERTHMAADNALLDFINDPEVTAAFEAIYKWYA